MSNYLFLAANFENSFDFSYIFKSIVSRWYLYLLLAVVIIGVMVFAIIKKPKRPNLLSKTQRIAYISIFIALSVAVNIFQIPFPLVQLSFVATVCYIAGMLLGPIDGFVVAFMGDLIAGIVAPLGPYSPIIGIGTAMFGFVPGVIQCYFKKNDILNGIIAYLITFLLTSVIINTIGLCLIYSSMVLAEKAVLLPLNLLFHIINCVISILLIKAFKRILPKDKFLLDYKESASN